MHASPVYLALGTNLGDRRAQLLQAVRLLPPAVTVEKLSDVYETEPAYVSAQPRYLNMVLAGCTTLSPRELLSVLKAIEQEMGRQRTERWGPRPIDLDILLYDDWIVNEPDLQIPHPRLHERPFVLQPLAELAPDLVLPGHTLTVRQLAEDAPPIGAIIARLGPLLANA